jgi:ribosomal protein L13
MHVPLPTMVRAMTKTNVQVGDRIIVSDGCKALLTGDEGNEVFPTLETQELRGYAKASNRVLNMDKPERMY